VGGGWQQVDVGDGECRTVPRGRHGCGDLGALRLARESGMRVGLNPALLTWGSGVRMVTQRLGSKCGGAWTEHGSGHIRYGHCTA
jgi:hypothetical protein